MIMKRMDKFTCRICRKECKSNHSLTGHLRNKHNIFKSDHEKYYRKFLIKEDEDKCNYCGNETRFLTITSGFQKYCNHKCYTNWIKGKTYEEIYSEKACKKMKELQSNRTVTDEERLNTSKRMKLNNPMSNEKTRLKVKKTLLENHPSRGKTYEEIYGEEKAKEMKEERKDMMLNGGAAKARRGMKSQSKPQIELFKLVKKLFPNAELEYPCCNKSVDIAIVEHMIAIEYDEPYWHQDKIYDRKRKILIESNGWKCINYTKIPTLSKLEIDIYSLI